MTYWPAQVLFTGVALTPLWASGLVWSLRSPQAARFRPLGIACAIVIALQFALGGKPYYPGGAYLFLFAAGAVPAGRLLAARRRRLGLAPAAQTAAAMLISAAVALPIAIPVLPARVLAVVPLQKINYDLAETIGWPKLTALVSREYHQLPPVQRARTTILTGNYGEAGAFDRYGPADGLPAAYSGANNFWLWGPPPAGDTSAIAVNVDPALLRREFTRRPPAGHVPQRPRRQRRRARRPGVPGHRTADQLAAGLAGLPRLLLTRRTRPGRSGRAGGDGGRARDDSRLPCPAGQIVRRSGR